MRELRTSVEISANAEKVWSTLMDFDKYPEWNPFINYVKGDISEGGRLEVQVGPQEGKQMTFRPTVISIEPNKRFSWLGSLGIPGIMNGKHIFEIEESGEGKVKFVHREEFSGLLVPLLWKKLDGETRQGFELMNKALKKICEE